MKNTKDTIIDTITAILLLCLLIMSITAAFYWLGEYFKETTAPHIFPEETKQSV